jgi:hypothetical protein
LVSIVRSQTKTTELLLLLLLLLLVIKVSCCFCSSEHNALEMYEAVEVLLHVFLASAFDAGE